MTVQECYVRMGADYDGVQRRLGKEERVRKFLVRLPEDPSFGVLSEAVVRKDGQEAFRAAHSIKGICMNLGLTPLYRSSASLAEELRAGSVTEAALGLFEDVKRDYEFTLECVRWLGQV